MAGRKKNVSAAAAAEETDNKTMTAAASAKKAGSKSKETKTTVFIEYNHGQINVDDICRDVIAACGSGSNKPEKVEIYVKPEERVAYFVADGKAEGRKIELYF